MTDRCDRSLFARVSDLEDHGAALDAVCASRHGAREHEGFWEFSDIDHGTMPAELRDWLVCSGIAFAWENCAGYEYGGGVIVPDPSRVSSEEFSTVDGQIALTLAEMNTPGRIDAARAAADLWSDIAKESALASAD
ncbi:MAG: hypothetical protein DI556_13270 [Rhodovulum sulfidophilum]|uniref:Uncharacterized protein n=1 Tax=Rhodovulum sulfidophilum TaxID=35806 RepID=A0A2W5QBJ9_RHOSU|nr:MAG: hypothetical protein DI556_13270 [Rhodovulum sulfidophilum]